MNSRAWQPSLAKFARFPSRIWRFDWLRAYLIFDLEATTKPCQATLIMTLKVLTKTPTDIVLLLDQLAPRFGWKNRSTSCYLRDYQHIGRASVTYSFEHENAHRLQTQRENVFVDVWDVFDQKRSYSRFKFQFAGMDTKWHIIHSKMSFAQFADDMINVFSGQPTNIIVAENLPNLL